MKVSRKNKLLGTVMHHIATLATKTVRVRVSGQENIDALRAEGVPILASAWHGMGMQLVIYFRQKVYNPKAMVMIPDDWRGETLYHWIKRTGLRPQPMDLENKGLDMARKFANLVRFIKTERYDTVVLPDGPGGPSFEPKPGILYMAQKTGFPIVPLGFYSRNAYEINRWDAYAIPLPFSRMQVVVGEPLLVPRKIDYGAMRDRLRDVLNRATLQAKMDYYAR